MTMMRNRKSSFLFGGNAPYIEEQYEQYLADPASVSPEWQDYFQDLAAAPAVDGSASADVAHAPVVEHFVALAKKAPGAKAPQQDVFDEARRQVGVHSLVNAYRTLGTRHAQLDPLKWFPVPHVPELQAAFHGLTNADLESPAHSSDTSLLQPGMKVKELVTALQQTYCGTLGAEYMHLADAEQRRWWQQRLESGQGRPAPSIEQKLRILDRLTAAEGLEKYLHTRYVGQTRFSLEGGESLIVLLDELVQAGAAQGVKNVVMGMAHRGRLNVLVNVAGKPVRELFDEFEGRGDGQLIAGDVKYHKGHTGVVDTAAGPVEVLLAYNASHLEIVNPVVQGIARGKAEELRVDKQTVLPVEIHGDAAISGQGVVMETMNMSYVRGHSTSGTVHVVINNQVGFTSSDPFDARSSFYCTDIAKMIDAPVLHVNGDDPEAVQYAARLAVEFRAAFKRSVMIELVCFRRHGHQEQDTPTMTQPLMYRAIAAHPGVRALYARSLVKDWLVTETGVEKMVQHHREQLDAQAALAGQSDIRQIAAPASDEAPNREGYLAPTLETLSDLAGKITELPATHKLHPLVARVMDARKEMADGTRPIDWGMGEHLAYASLLAEGTDVRLSGQDSERGTFGHRHAVIHDQNRAQRSQGRYTPLDHISNDQGRFRVTNSILSEAAVLGFEYGYSVVRDRALVLWEAQFGDFANGAQVIVDQFLSAGFAKWGQRSSVVMLLPHGQDGKGPEHASARLERYLQLCAQQNIIVAQPTTPAQFFHLLRLQARTEGRRPLIVMTPKSLLRHPGAVSSLNELVQGSFSEVLADTASSAKGQVRRVILSSGKVYYDLVERRSKASIDDTAILRVEQLYPFPAAQIQTLIAQYPNAEEVVWCQEEAANQGAWSFVEPQLRKITGGKALRYAGAEAMSSTAPGYPALHASIHEGLITAALEG